YIQQNKLFTYFEEQSVFENWVLPHPQSTDLYETLLRVCQVLQAFGVYMPADNNSLEYICSVTKKWIQGNSLKDIISDQIAWDLKYAAKNERNPSSTNKSVRD